MMKKVLLLLLAMSLVFGLVSCAGEQLQTGETTDSENQSGNAQTVEGDVVLFGGDDDYNLVYSPTATTAVKDILVQISDAVKQVTGKGPKRVGDNSKTEKESPKEILIAVTNRPQSNTVMEKITSVGYRVEFVDSKLVIAASNDTMLQMAVNELLEKWTVADGRIILNSETVLEKDMTGSMHDLFENGNFLYRIIVKKTAPLVVREEAEELAERLSTLAGKTITVEYDTDVPQTADAYEICIGETNREVSSELYSELETVFEYKIALRGTYIAVASKNTDCLVKAITLLIEDMAAALFGNYCGTPAIAKDYEKSGALVAELVGFPDLGGKNPKGVYEIAKGEYVMYYENVAETDYTQYVTALQAEGCAIDSTYTLGDNKYTLMENDKYSVYIAYLAEVDSLRVIFGKPDVDQPAPAAVTKSNVCEPALWQLEVDCLGSESNGGMSYVIQLTDGTFVVVDGGYRTTKEATDLYNLLKANTPGGGEPVISAWLISHLHIDHWGCLQTFTEKYADKVQVKAFYYNFPGVEMDDINMTVKNNVEGIMKKWNGAKLYGKLHSGMNFSVVDAKFTVICTYEDVFPRIVSSGNDTTTVFKVEVGGQSIMFLGDAYDKESAVMFEQLNAEALKSDIVQISHHGYEGCSRQLYEVIAAPTVLWPMPITSYDDKAIFRQWYSTGNTNAYFREDATVKKIIISGTGTQKLVLPYTPTGTKLPANY